MTALEDRYIDVDGVRLRWWQTGEGPDVVLVHGFGSFCETWRGVIRALAPTRRVTCLDLPGFGWSAHPAGAPYGIPWFADVVDRFMGAVRIARASIVGHSMGGGIAQWLAAERPGRVERVALVAPVGFGRRGSWLLRLMSTPGLGELMVRAQNRASVRLFMRHVVADEACVPAELIELALAAAQQPAAGATALTTLRSMVAPTGLRAEVLASFAERQPRIAAETLVVWGDRDTLLFLDEARPKIARIPNMRLEVLPGCGHFPMIERPDETERLLTAFLA